MNIKVGDFVRSYYKGYFIVTETYDLPFEKQKIPQVKLEQVFTENFKKKRGKKSCAMSYCEKVDIDLLKKEKEEKLKEITDGYDTVIKYLKENK